MTQISQTSALIVDDNMMMRQMARNVLRELGFTDIDVASNGKEALNKVHGRTCDGNQYALILLDWNMPELDGFSFLKICRNELKLSDIAIVMLTSVSESKNVIEALQAGATFYITKPVSTETLSKKLSQLKNWQAQKKA